MFYVLNRCPHPNGEVLPPADQRLQIPPHKEADGGTMYT